MQFSITLIIIIITVLVSWQGFNRYEIIERLKHHPYSEVRNGEWFRMITSGFVHSGWFHLFINMFVLYEFGQYIEAHYLATFGHQWGRLIFVLLYVLTIIAGDVPTLIKHKNNPAYASIGASGAVSGILFIYILLNPWNTLMLYGVIPIPALLAGVGFLWYSSWASKNRNDRIDHMAHFYGAVFGVLFTVILQPSLLGHFFRTARDVPFF